MGTGREGIEQDAEDPLIKAFLIDSKVSYPRCYPQVILRKTATEPGTLGQFSAEPLSHCTVYSLPTLAIGCEPSGIRTPDLPLRIRKSF
jgi:hypothetical protein